MRKVLSVIQLLTMVIVNFLLDRIDLSLDVTKGPLLRLLHLNHHFLNLFELLKAVGLHLFELLLFLNEHIEASFFIVTKECVHSFVLDSQWSLGLCFEAFVKLVGRLWCWCLCLWLRRILRVYHQNLLLYASSL